MPVEAEVCEQNSRSRKRSLISLFLLCPLPLRLPYTTRHLVLDRNIMDDNEQYAEILNARVLATVVDGGVVYGSL